MTVQAPTERRGRMEEIAYVAPFAVFMLFVWVGGQAKWLYPVAYVARAVIVAILLAVFWKYYTKINWRFWWLGATGGVIGIFQWVAMQLWLQNHFEYFRPKLDDVFNP